MGQQSVGRRFLPGLLSALAAVWAALVLPAAALGQVASSLPAAPPLVQRVDKNNINTNNSISYRLPLLSIGPSGPAGLSFEALFNGSAPSGWSSNLTGVATLNGGGIPFFGVAVSVGNRSDAFALQNGAYVSTHGTGATVSVASNGAGAGYTITYRPTDGTVYVFNDGLGTTNNNLVSITYPTGEVVAFTYGSTTINRNGVNETDYRLTSVTVSTGYGIHFDYDPNNYLVLLKATAWNMAVETCSPTATTCSFNPANNWPTASFTQGVPGPASITDAAGVTTSFTYTGYVDLGGYYLTKISKPNWSETFGYATVTGCNSTVQPCNAVTTATIGGTWSYTSASSYNSSAQTGTTYNSVIDPYGNLSSLIGGGATASPCGFPNNSQDALGRQTVYQCDPNYNVRITRVTLPEGGYKTYAYDSNGNLTTVTAYPKPSVGGAAVVIMQANYPCTSAATCDKPGWVKDANGVISGARTDYTYDSGTGLLMEAQAPAVTVNGASVRRTTANSYAAIPTVNGSVYRLVSSATCAKTVATVSISGLTATLTCTGGASDQVVTTTSYAGSSNALPTSVTVGSGDGVLTVATATAYDNYGDVNSVTDPMGFVSKTWFDAARRKVGVVGPDPDGTGALLYRSQRILYAHPDGLLSEVDQGTSTGYDNPAASGSSFVPLIQTATAYDSIDRKSQETVTAGGTTYAVTQFSYDLASRLQCTAVRMNTAAFGSLPASACTLGTTGSYGPDRITYDSYDAADELVKVTSGYATGLQRDEKTIVASAYVSTPFTGDGLPAAVRDGDGNVSAYRYDGFDRISELHYPSPTSPGSSSTSDYEAFSYDPGGNITSHRLRDGTSIGFAYDALSRKTAKTPPEAANAVAYGYDALGRLLSENFTNNAALNLSFTYDALGRKLTETGPRGTVTSQWDADGRRIQMKWPGTDYIAYTWDAAGEMLQVQENGATSGPGLLASFSYDNLGHRTQVVRGNGLSTTYAYDSAGRLTALAHAGATNTQAYSAIGYDPAGGMVKFTTSNGAYAWAAGAATTGYALNGQNQYTSVGASPYSYDARGNLATTASSGAVFSYDSENRLTGMTPDVSLSYLPNGALYQTVKGGTTTRFLYDGDQIVAEYDGSNALLRRYVPGPAIDEPLVWYEGSGLSNRRWLMADHQGSVIAWADTSGAIPAANIYTYDEYGQPGPSNSGRFQYTGQAWIPELAAYDYRARDYLPGIGRFMQTDPKGYDAGLNLYDYVDDDPVDHTDPSGMSPLSDWFAELADKADAFADSLMAIPPDVGGGPLGHDVMEGAAVGLKGLAALTAGSRAARGAWMAVNESKPLASEAFELANGGRRGMSYVVNGVKFDGVIGGSLIESKANYAQFVGKNGVFEGWWANSAKGGRSLVAQAGRQLGAANGAKVVWRVDSNKAAGAIRALFKENGVRGVDVQVAKPVICTGTHIATAGLC